MRAARAVEFASRARSPKSRQIRLSMVRNFALAMRSEESNHEVPPPDALGCVIARRPKPYIYSSEEIFRLIRAAAQLPPAGSMRPLTYATLFGLLAATGMRISEALALKLEDVTEDGLIIRNTKFGKSRLLPLHDTTHGALNRYLSKRMRLTDTNDDLLVSNTGRAPAYPTVERVFRQLSLSVGLRTGSGRGWPRMHDLRHTFAVRCLERCKGGREAAGRCMLALSTYLGHGQIANTYWYLEATPLLMRQIASAGETHYTGEPS